MGRQARGDERSPDIPAPQFPHRLRDIELRRHRVDFRHKAGEGHTPFVDPLALAPGQPAIPSDPQVGPPPAGLVDEAASGRKRAARSGRSTAAASSATTASRMPVPGSRKQAGCIPGATPSSGVPAPAVGRPRPGETCNAVGRAAAAKAVVDPRPGGACRRLGRGDREGARPACQREGEHPDGNDPQAPAVGRLPTTHRRP